MNKITLTEQKKVMLEILRYIDELASQNNLRYSLWGGTMLGAVRHKGYIPWDDDIDISLPREDYNRLLELLKDRDEYMLLEYSIQNDYTRGWAKLAHRGSVDKRKKFFPASYEHGIFVDLIPIDGLPSKEEDIKRLKEKVYFLYRLILASKFPSYASNINFSDSLKRLIRAFPLYLASKAAGGKKKLVARLNNLSQSYPLENADKCGHLLSRYYKKLGYPSSIWDELREYEFEGYRFKGIADSHTYLTLLYGDNYMEVPPVSKQIIHEEHEFYWKESVADEDCDDNGQRLWT